MIKFLHISDVHLGCRRYNLEERTKDFFRSWYDVIENHALANEVDFVLIAGDFFDRRQIDPQTMIRSTMPAGDCTSSRTNSASAARVASRTIPT